MNIYGASGHGKVIIDIIKSTSKESIDYVIDDNINIKELIGYKVSHRLTPEILNYETIVAIGDNAIRRKIASSFEGAIGSALVHKNAVISNSTVIGKGTTVMANAVINACVNIGENCIVNTSAVVEHDVIINDYAHISPGAIVTGNVSVGEGSHIGAGAIIIPGLKIGKWSTIGAGAVIIKDVPDYAVVVGNPGKIIKFKNRLDE